MLSQGLILSLPYTNYWYRLTYVRNFICNPQNHVLLTYLQSLSASETSVLLLVVVKFSDWKTIADTLYCHLWCTPSSCPEFHNQTAMQELIIAPVIRCTQIEATMLP